MTVEFKTVGGEKRNNEILDTFNLINSEVVIDGVAAREIESDILDVFRERRRVFANGDTGTINNPSEKDSRTRGLVEAYELILSRIGNPDSVERFRRLLTCYEGMGLRDRLSSETGITEEDLY